MTTENQIQPSPSVSSKRRFGTPDQEAFARLSGDRNPIHMDEMFARRTQAGAVVVHGVHGLLWTLEEVARTRSLSRLGAISAKFLRYLYLDAPAEIRITDQEQGLLAELVCEGVVATRIKLSWAPPAVAGVSLSRPDEPVQLFGREPDAVAFEDMDACGGRLDLSSGDDAQSLFPRLSAAIGTTAVKAIALVSGVVGMACPGLHSLFVELTLKRVQTSAGLATLDWRTARTNASARWVVLEFAGAGWAGEVNALARQEPVQTLPMSDLSRHVRGGEFAGRTALVVGGSRGLGAVTAKLLGLGGARVIITYARGLKDAEAVTADIRAACGQGACDMMQCDVTGDVAAQLAGLPGVVNHLYYFATPQISRQKTRPYERGLLDAFVTVYVDGFAAVWDALVRHRPLTVFYPSTVFIDERPRGMTEYAMAKAAAEQLCDDLARRRRDVSMTTPRIPRVLTDQTATSPPTPALDPVDVMLPLLRAQSLPNIQAKPDGDGK